MTIVKTLWVESMLLLLGCAVETQNVDPNVVDFNSALNGELSRCQATGRSRAQCCDDHDIDPCPGVAITVPAPLLYDPPIVVGRR
jgi:hypothetical protein